MSDAESARERRRNKILASKEERMSRIISGHTEEKASTPSETKVSQDKPKPKAEVKVKSATEEKPKPVVAKTVETKKDETSAPTATPVVRKTGRSLHVLIVIAVALAVFALSEFSGRPMCGTQLGSRVCEVVKGNQYGVTIGFFVGTEAFEFLLGRMGSVDGSSPMDAGLLVKDIVLFSFLILLLQHARNCGLF